ncbi:hypothetical protein DLAC_08313 [Tieghemostelium lacteum]|uniref:FHA domain-containing protein n=1 Tax=Tieghemostelium lacteum TaxID=361077 RepID=A0A151ZBQ0_TIELA|nr:hypothetical protein DLAC_08313 [Tieghemostelium lacteum]|eukprot:KYQ91361.1 hypothetical protein DLAC_08313 [Tieghemostelium lacteum]
MSQHSNETTPNSKNKNEFLMPISSKNVLKDENNNVTFKLPQRSSTVSVQTPTSVSPTSEKRNENVELLYKEPTWSSLNENPEGKYKIEVIKGGVVVEDIDIGSRAYYLIGRIPICDIVLDHISISRQHAVIQHRRDSKMLFIYDLGSSHGTFINKQRIKANSYQPIKNGDILKFGESTRILVLTCPEYENISDRTVVTTTKAQENSKLTKDFVSYFTSKDKNREKELVDIQKSLQERGRFDNDYDNDNEDQKDTIETSENNGNRETLDTNDIEDDDDEFYDRTSQNKEKFIKEYNKKSYQQLIEKRDELQLEKLQLQAQFKDTTVQNKNIKKVEEEDEEEDSLDKFMMENETALKNTSQQKILASLLEIETKISYIDSLIKNNVEFKKNSTSSVISKPSDKLEQQQQQQQVKPKQKVPFKDDSDDLKPKSRAIEKLSDEIPIEYRLSNQQKKRELTKNEKEEIEKKSVKKLKEKQEEEYIDLTSRDSDSGNSSKPNRFGY